MSAGAGRDFQAKWVWARVETPQPFQFVEFRKTIDITTAPDRVTAFVTADALYRLRVNGQYVMNGPARSSVGRAAVDPIDIKPFLKPGENIITVEALHGNVMFEALAQAPGFLCEIEIESNGENRVIGTDSTWEAREDKTWNRKAPKFSFQRGWIEDIDSRLEQDKKWQPAVVLGKVGMAPWKIVELRDVPLPSRGIVRPTSIAAMHRSAGTDPTPIIEKWVDRLASEPLSKVDAGTAIELPLSLPGKGESITYDFGRNEVGFISFEVTGKAGDVLELVWGERIYDKSGAPRPNQGISAAQTMRYILRDGKQSFLGFTPQLVRFLRIINRSEGSVKLSKVWLTQFHFGAPSTGEFKCSDDALNRIYDAARWTLTLNTLDTFMDCPSRERGGWYHDGYWNATAAYAMFGDLSVNRRMCRQGAQSQDDPDHVGPDGTVAMVYPAKIASCPDMIPAHELMWVMQVGLDSRFTGDIGFTREMLPAIRRLFNGLATWRNVEGLLEIPGGVRVWNFLDWADIKGGSISVGLNAIYARALDEAARLERIAGDSAQAANYEKTADEVRESLNRWCGDGLYYPDVLERSEKKQLTPSREACEATQYYVMWAGVPSEDRIRRMWQSLRDDFVPAPGKRVQPIQGLTRAGLFSNFERLLLAAQLSDYDAFIRDTKAMFLPMATSVPGTFWESPWADSSLCHGFGSTVSAFLAEEILGIELEVPLRITPHGGSSITWCKGSIRTPRGKISADWSIKDKVYELRVALPKGVTAEVTLPEEARAIWAMSAPRTEWKNKIEIKGRTAIEVTPGSVVIE